ncbi:hypothetical protein [Enterovirga rhinocerotis]|uniref:Uncharacterized protein n=1 Tax=Enterovirga rhinocerotis TaxID=1339210 RepID=A0A4R7C4A9_9HYPH|nr:hypothetical protein [Enterovirga rhinocerotis]TDR93360.1 hypothetical protein EV668_0620 [Enterovirga rhinocerotis]
MSASDPTDIVSMPAESAPLRRGEPARPRRLRRRRGASTRPLPESYLRDVETIRALVDWFGAHLICPRSGCGRAGRCTDVGEPRFPFCFRHYRGEIRYALELVGAHLGLDGAWYGVEAPHRGPSFLGALAAQGVRIEALRQPRGRREEWSWARDPDATARLAELRAEGKARRAAAPLRPPACGSR